MQEINTNKKYTLDDLLSIMSMLRDKLNGCPWDVKQTMQSIVPHTLEEVYEVIDAIEQEDYAHLPNELGDLLFQVIFYSQVGKEQNLFRFEDVIQEICRKLLTRHPHVFPDATIESFGKRSDLTPEQVEKNWEKIKSQEKAIESEQPIGILTDIPLALPALDRAVKIQKRVSKVGFDWIEAVQVFDKILEETKELEQAVLDNNPENINEEFGDLMFSMVNLGRKLGIKPESSLREANKKFIRRFQEMEKMLYEKKQTIEDLTSEEMEEYWQLVKQKEN